MKINYEIMNDNITVSKVSFYWLFKFMWRTLFFEKAVFVINVLCLLISMIFSVIFQVFTSQQDQVVILFNYYFIFFVSMLMFILALRISMVMWSNKMDDQTVMNLVISNNSRSRIILSFFICALVNIFATVSVNSLIIIIPELIHNVTGVLVKNTLVAAGYSLLTSGAIIWFLTFGMLFFNRNVALMISVLILTLQLVSAIPQKFHLTKEESTYLTFENGVMSVSRIRNVIDLQQHILENQIKYPLLSNYINQWFLQNNMQNGQAFSNSTNLVIRNSMWSELGLINNQNPRTLSLTDQVVNQVPSGFNNLYVGNNVDLSLIFTDSFISVDSLDAMVQAQSSPIPAVLNQFYQFVNDIQTNFSTNIDFQSFYVNKFDNFFKISEGSTMTNKENGTQYTLQTSDLVNIYQNFFLTGFGGLSLDKHNNDETNAAYVQLRALITESLFNPVRLAARIIEDYFIGYTADYLNITSPSNRVVVQNDTYKNYARSAVINNLLYWLNPIASIQSIYTNFAGISSENIWFEYLNTSNILFNKQSNLFLTYPLYSLQIVDGVVSGESYKNYTPVWIFILLLVLITLIVAVISVNKFNRMDLN